MKSVKHQEPKGYEAKRVPGRDAHSASEKALKTQATGAQSHSGGGRKKEK